MNEVHHFLGKIALCWLRILAKISLLTYYHVPGIWNTRFWTQNRYKTIKATTKLGSLIFATKLGSYNHTRYLQKLEGSRVVYSACIYFADIMVHYNLMEDVFSNLFREYHHMSTLNLILVLILVYVTRVIRSIVLPPANFPRNIPTIPFYVSFLGYLNKSDQRTIYDLHLRQKLEKYGAVKIYFASRWNIMITRPSFLKELFSKESIYAKSGNHIKIPYAVLSAYTGDNIISSHGENWKLYRSIVASSIQFPDTNPVVANAERFMFLLDEKIKCSKSVMVGDVLQRFSLQNAGQSILGLDLDALSPNSEVHQKVVYIKKQIFEPLFLNFPYLDKFPIPSRMKAKYEVEKFRDYFSSKVYSEEYFNNLAGKRLVGAYQKERLSRKQFQDNSIILMVAGHENPLLLMTSLLYCIAKHSHVQTKLRKELEAESNEDSGYFDSVVYETLRMFPPLGQIINRITTRTTVLGNDIIIPEGTYVGYNNFGTGTDATVWGSNANEFKPERWGTTSEEVSKCYKTAKRTGQLPAFHGGKRACLGEKFALFETRVIVLKILKKYKIALDPNWKELCTPAGPICPVNLQLVFDNLELPK